MACLRTERGGSEQAARPTLCLTDLTVGEIYLPGIPQVPSQVLTQKLSSLQKMTVCRTLTAVVLTSLAPGCAGSGHPSLPPHQLSWRKG